MRNRLSFEVFPTVLFEPCTWFELALRSTRPDPRLAVRELLDVADVLAARIPRSAPHKLELRSLRKELQACDEAGGRAQLLWVLSLVFTAVEPFRATSEQPIIQALTASLAELGVPVSAPGPAPPSRPSVRGRRRTHRL